MDEGWGRKKKNVQSGSTATRASWSQRGSPSALFWSVLLLSHAGVEKKKKREKDCAGLLSDNGPFYREVGFVYTALWHSEACGREEWGDCPVGRTKPCVTIRQKMLLKYKSNEEKKQNKQTLSSTDLLNPFAAFHIKAPLLPDDLQRTLTFSETPYTPCAWWGPSSSWWSGNTGGRWPTASRWWELQRRGNFMKRCFFNIQIYVRALRRLE